MPLVVRLTFESCHTNRQTVEHIYLLKVGEVLNDIAESSKSKELFSSTNPYDCCNIFQPHQQFFDIAVLIGLCDTGISKSDWKVALHVFTSWLVQYIIQNQYFVLKWKTVFLWQLHLIFICIPRENTQIMIVSSNFFQQLLLTNLNKIHKAMIDPPSDRDKWVSIQIQTFSPCSH